MKRANPAAPTCLKKAYFPSPVAAAPPPILPVVVGACVEFCFVVVFTVKVLLPVFIEGEIENDPFVTIEPPELVSGGPADSVSMGVTGVTTASEVGVSVGAFANHCISSV